jgi:chitin disaccharide deacetylase
MESGVVTSASLLVNMAAHDDAIRRLRDARARGLDVSIGLHFNIVAGAPLTDCPSLLTDRDRFLRLQTLAWRAFTGRIDRRDVERELGAQLARAEDLLAGIGMRLTHIDSHRHAHCLPGILDVVLRAARERGIGHVRHPVESSRTLLGRPLAIAATQILRLAIATRAGVDDVGFAGFALMGSRTLDRDLSRMLHRLPAGATELMVHPGYDSPELAALDPYRTPREREVRALTSPVLRDRIRELGIDLARFGATAALA